MDEITDSISAWAERAWAFMTDNPVVFMLAMFGLVAFLTWLGL